MLSLSSALLGRWFVTKDQTGGRVWEQCPWLCSQAPNLDLRVEERGIYVGNSQKPLRGATAPKSGSWGRWGWGEGFNSTAGARNPGRRCQGHGVPEPRTLSLPGGQREPRWTLSPHLCPLCVSLPSGAPLEDARSLPDAAALPVKRLHAALGPTRRQHGRPSLAPDLPVRPRSRQRQPGSQRPSENVRSWDRKRN